jgi:pimeloyl-ACP methyl ester carboxylesterase
VREPQPLTCTQIGTGPPIILLHAYGMLPRTYVPLADELAHRARVVIPDLFSLARWWEWWDFEHTVDCLEVTLDDLGLGRVTVIGHSFGGGLELGLAARCPERMVECVFADTLGPRRQLSLARETFRPVGIVRTATRPAAVSFVESWARHPVQLISAAFGGYLSERDQEVDAVARAGVRCHVLWAEGDEILSRDDGEEFARRLGATFTAAERPPGHDPIDHDWVLDEPELFARYLDPSACGRSR